MLDQNFPWLAFRLPWPPSINIVPLARINPHLISGVEDWEVLRALGRHGGVHGFITNDADFLNLGPEAAAIFDSKFALVTTTGVGHDALRATGLLMVHLPGIRASLDGTPRVHELRPSGRRVHLARDVVSRAAQREGITAAALLRKARREARRPSDKSDS